MSTNNVTFTLALIPDNAEKIDQINRIILGDSYTASAPAPSKETKTSKAVKETTKSETKEETSGVTADQFKKAAQAAKKDHGEDFCMEVLKEQGVKVGASLGRSIGKVDEDDRQTVMDLWSVGPTEQASDEPEDDDDFGDEDLDGDDEAEVTVDAVKAALKAYAKEVGRDEARELMQSAGAKSLSAVGDLSSAKLSGLMKKLV